MVIFAIVSALLFAKYERATFQRGATERTLALLTAVDAELKSSVTTLQALATSPNLDTGNLRGFHEEAKRVLKSQPAWHNILLTQPSGQQIVTAERPFGAAHVRVIEQPSFERALQTGAPVVGNIVYNSARKNYTFAVRLPVVRDGATKYVLSAVVKPQAMHELLARQEFPADWVGVIIDGNNNFVARTIGAEQIIGEPASQSMQAALARSSDGWFRGATVEGNPVYTPYNRSPFSGWTVAMGIPAAVVDGAAFKTATWLTAGIVGAGVTALLLAFVLGRRISTPIVSLASAANDVGRGVQPEIPRDPGVDEVADLGRALEDAAGAVRAREETQNQLAAVVEASSDAIFSCTLDGTIRTWNPAATRLFGYTVDEACGRHLSFLAPRAGTPTLMDTLAAVARGEFITTETVHVRKDGAPVDVALTGSPIRNQAGVVSGIAGIVRDITERKRAEALQQQLDTERRGLLAAAEQARAEAESANRAKDVFMAMLGHELRNPLGAIASAVGVLNVRAPEAAAARARTIIGRQVQHLAHLVDDLLDVSRVTTGKVFLNRRPLNLADVVTDVAHAWRTAGRFERHRVSVDAVPVWVEADETRMEQIISNLLGNAVKYTPADGSVSLLLASDGDSAVLKVADTGVGIPADDLDKVFDLFVQGEQALDRAQGGIGVGLTLVRSLVVMHGGTVEANSNGVNKGTVFTVRLPRIAPPGQQPVPRPELTAGGARQRVLLIEDNDDARTALGDVLSADGHEVHQAADGPSGIEAALRLHPDVVLVDVGLPGLDGYEVAQRIRSAQNGKPVRLIALTGYGRSEDKERARIAGFDAHLVKPIDLDRLYAVFRR